MSDVVHLDAEGGPRVLFAAAEFSPLSRVGGLAEAGAGLVAALRRRGLGVGVVVPDYDGSPDLEVRSVEPLDVPAWVGPAIARHGRVAGVGRVTVISIPGLERPHPYNDPDTGLGWEDNDRRFLAFSASVAALAVRARVDLVHVNDWHTAAVTAWLPDDIPSVLTVHNLSYQGVIDSRWAEVLGPHRSSFEHDGALNLLAGGIRLADRVASVSPAYAIENRRQSTGAGLHGVVRSRGGSYVGIRNGIDVDRWDPATNPLLPAPFDAVAMDGKSRARAVLSELVGWDPLDRRPIAVVLSRFVEQKGIDTVVSLAPKLSGLGVRLVMMGRGEPDLERLAVVAAAQAPTDVAYLRRTEAELAHLVIAGAEIMIVPSRFEPCGLTPMEAMRYGTVPVVSPVGGLRNTVVDADANRVDGNGFVAPASDEVGLWLAVGRAVRAHSDHERWAEIRTRGMCGDWSWREPADRYTAVYGELVGSAGAPPPPVGEAPTSSATTLRCGTND